MQIGDSRQQPAPLFGLVLAGGDSARMGEDKGTLDYHGAPQAAHLHALLAQRCQRSFVSINAAQQGRDPYRKLPVIVDSGQRQGPASGLLSAWRAHSEAAWLVIAVDLVWLDDQTLATLVAGRRASAVGTAFCHPDNTLEPLCAIWEPTGCALLADRVEAGDASPRRCLESIDLQCLACPDPKALRSIDSPAQRAKLLRER